MAHEYIKRKIRYFWFNISEFGIRYAFMRLTKTKRSADNGILELIPQRKYGSLSVDKYPKHIKKWYYSKTGKKLNLEHPRLFSEKIQWLKLYGNNILYTRLADKYEVRKWVADKIGEEHLIPLLGAWQSFDEINFEELPKEFVLKCTHGSACNLVVTDKTKIDITKEKKKFDFWMSLNYAFVDGFELQYRDIPPRIIAEKYIEVQGMHDLPDYKIHCFSGEPKFVQVISNREIAPQTYYYNLDWDKIDFSSGTYPVSTGNVARPPQLDKMIDVARSLCHDIPYVRVDLYLPDDKRILFGEMTFTPASGALLWQPESCNEIMGDWIGELVHGE